MEQTVANQNYTGSFFIGDANDLYGMGGNDIATGLPYDSNNLYGDAISMYAGSKGGNDTLTGGTYSTANYIRGEAWEMYASTGGNDILTGGANSISNQISGDA